MLRAGRTLTTCSCLVYSMRGTERTACATAVGTLMRVAGRSDSVGMNKRVT